MNPKSDAGISRRGMIAAALAAPVIAALPALGGQGRKAAVQPAAGWFSISLAQWSLHRTLQKGELDNLDFPRHAKDMFGITQVEYVNSFFKGRADAGYIGDLKKRCEGEGVKSLLIMCDGEGALGDPDEEKRIKAVENHKKWVDAAATLGCHSVRVNAQSRGGFEEQRKLAADGLRRLAEFADTRGINVIVENHWGLSSNGAWLVKVIRTAAHTRVGTLPDFGNFDPKEYDRYEGVEEMMPFAKGVSAKSHDFDEKGNETGTDYRRMLGIVKNAGYRGAVGIEYEGSRLPEAEGILATRRLLDVVREELQKPVTEGAER